MNKRYLTELEEVLNDDQQTVIQATGSYPSPAHIQAAMQRARHMRSIAYSLAIKHLAARVLTLFSRIGLVTRFLPAPLPYSSVVNGSKHAPRREIRVTGFKPALPDVDTS